MQKILISCELAVKSLSINYNMETYIPNDDKYNKICFQVQFQNSV